MYKKLKVPLLLYAFSIFIFLSIWGISLVIKSHSSPENKTSEFEQILNERYIANNALVNALSTKFDNPNFDLLNIEAVSLPKKTTLFVLNNDYPLYWSDNSTPFEVTNKKERIIKTPDGWYQQCIAKNGDYSYILLDLISHDYPYQNDYLKREFNQVYNLSPDFTLSFTGGQYPVKDESGKTLLYLSLNTSTPNIITWEQQFVLYLLLLISYIILIMAVYQTFSLIINKKFKVIWLTLAIVIFIRILQFQFGIPGFFKEFEIFSPLVYASSTWLPSLGDLLLNVTIAVLLSFIVYKVSFNFTPTKQIWKYRHIILISCLVLFNFSYYLTLHLIDTLIINSSFELNLSRVLDFNIYSYISYFIISLLLFSLFFITYTLLRIVNEFYRFKVLITSFLVFTVGLWITFYAAGFYIPQWEELILLLVFFLVLLTIVRGKLPFPKITTTTSLILILTTISTFCIYHNSETKENEERKLMALRLSSDQDKVAEYLYKELEKSILSDTVIRKSFLKAWYQPEFETECVDYVSKHLHGYWTKFNIQVTLCYPQKDLEIKPSGEIIGCDNYFRQIITNITSRTSATNLYRLNESYGVSNYIAKIPIETKEFEGQQASIVIEFTQKYVPKGLGYPELLLDKSFVSFYDLNVYSYAIYSRGELIKNVGEYSYSISEKPFMLFKKDHNFFDKNGYNHLYHIVNDDTSIIISKKKLSSLDKLAPFTYQLIFHIILVFVITTVYNLQYRDKRYPDIKSQLQIVLVLLVIFASVTTGFTTLKNIKNLNEQKNQDMLSEKAHSVLIEIEHKLDTIDYIKPEYQPFLQELLTKFSLVFFSDINIYNVDGILQATSRPEIFEEGLRSGFMSPEAYHQMAVNQRTFFVTNEQIGSYEYSSAYIPFRNKNNKIVAYINLPFFAREHELRQEISSFLVTFVNLYIILTAIAVFISLLVGNYVTRPLQLIRDKFTDVKLDKRNEKIKYNRRDELGNLINTYNLMLDKLEDSVDKLAQSERENAWKEMARQIAHEIKNPLTPMKLSIQHLYKSWQDKAPDWETRLEKTTNSIIQQIDSLASIASAFSDFAKFPQANNEKIELKELIKDTVTLFSSQKQFSITTHLPESEVHIYADKKQISRVLVNLLNNAIQSIPPEMEGKIEVQLESGGGLVVIKVIDNGVGIPPGLKAKIFSPNFTTKSSGTGLGLAMVKNIIDTTGGTITFHSDKLGTTFVITLPAFNKDTNS
jgi:signal transduction histidine kinase